MMMLMLTARTLVMLDQVTDGGKCLTPDDVDRLGLAGFSSQTVMPDVDLVIGRRRVEVSY